MVSSKRFLMFLQKEDSGIVVETIDSGHWEKLKDYERLGVKQQKLLMKKAIINYFK